jgi:CheY-like chemotaxis protein
MNGYTVFSAVTAEAALTLVEQHRPVGVILDLGMPVIDGLELARSLRDRHGPDLPLVAVTGWSDERKLDEAELAGVDTCWSSRSIQRHCASSFPLQRNEARDRQPGRACLVQQVR